MDRDSKRKVIDEKFLPLIHGLVIFVALSIILTVPEIKEILLREDDE